jgi:lysozyme
MSALEETIKRHEGYRAKPYQDLEGVWTIGFGRNLEDRGIREDEALLMLRNDIREAEGHLLRLFAEESREWTERRWNALVNMMFNLGATSFSGFKKMIEAIRAEDWDTAAEEMLDSKWAKQVKGRALELAEMVRNG